MVALNCTIVCICYDHTRGDLDLDRLVRKHDGFFGTDAEGEIVDGVAHIDPAFSAFHPPEDDIDAINARMTTRSQARAEVARRWEVGADYRDETLRSVRIVGSGSPHALAEAGEETEGISPTPRNRDGDPGAILPFSLRPATIVGWSTVGLLAVVAAVLSSGAALWVFAAVAAGLLAALPIDRKSVV